jgi:hypothetical protein
MTETTAVALSRALAGGIFVTAISLAIAAYVRMRVASFELTAIPRLVTWGFWLGSAVLILHGARAYAAYENVLAPFEGWAPPTTASPFPDPASYLAEIESGRKEEESERSRLKREIATQLSRERPIGAPPLLDCDLVIECVRLVDEAMAGANSLRGAERKRLESEKVAYYQERKAAFERAEDAARPFRNRVLVFVCLAALLQLIPALLVPVAMVLYSPTSAPLVRQVGYTLCQRRGVMAALLAAVALEPQLVSSQLAYFFGAVSCLLGIDTALLWFRVRRGLFGDTYSEVGEILEALKDMNAPPPTGGGVFGPRTAASTELTVSKAVAT